MSESFSFSKFFSLNGIIIGTVSVFAGYHIYHHAKSVSEEFDLESDGEDFQDIDQGEFIDISEDIDLTN